MIERIISWVVMVTCGVILLVYVASLAFGQGLSSWFLVGTGTAGVVVYFRNKRR